MKTALVCDWLTGMRGGERCFEIACRLFPLADVYTLVHVPGSVSSDIESHPVRTSFLQRISRTGIDFRHFLPLFPWAIERFDMSSYDMVLSFSHCVAKGIIPRQGATHICYCHTPVRYAWHLRESYLRSISPLGRPVARFMLERLRRWDKGVSGRVTHFIANSRNVRDRIASAYGRDSMVLYPPVDCSRFTPDNGDDGYYLIVSALVPYKRIDIAVDAFTGSRRRLLIVGSGPELERLKSRAGSNIEFVPRADDAAVARYMQRCVALIFPGEEDFGLVPVEAQACGKAVIAFGCGGALETVIGFDDPEGRQPTGIFFHDQSAAGLVAAIDRFESRRDSFSSSVCRANAMCFDSPLFQQGIARAVDGYLHAGQPPCR